MAFSENKRYINRGTSHTRRVIRVKIITTRIFPVKSADEAPISFPASRTMMVVEKFIKNIPNPNEPPLMDDTKFDFGLSFP